MPTEHEYKYVVSLDIEQKYSDADLRELSTEVQHIKQGYLAFSKGMTLRVRCLNTSQKKQWYLTFKQKIANRVIEIEKKLDNRDGKDLWGVCVGRLKKDRYVIEHHGHTWELDFFRKGGYLYFVQAEVELEEGAHRPEEVPDFLKDYIVFEVPLTDDRFSNKRLADVEYAYRLYQDLMEYQENDQKEL